MVSKKLQRDAGVQVGDTVFVAIHWDEQELQRVLKQQTAAKKGSRQPSRFMRRWGAHQKGNVVHLIEQFSRRVGRGLDFPCTYSIERGD